MGRQLASILLFLVSGFTGSPAMANNDWKKTWVMETNTLPTENSTGQELVDFRTMAAVGNGHIATVLYSPTVYMNGLYNGPVGWTHRAAIQSVHDLEVSLQGAEVTRTYAMDMWKAVFTETHSADGLEIKVQTYAHQRLVQLLVTEVHMTRTDSGHEERTLMLNRSVINSTVDLGIDQPEQETTLEGCGDGHCWYTHGRTFITETPDAEIGQVHIFWTDIPASLQLPAVVADRKWIFFSSYDKERSKASMAFQTALTLRDSTPDLLHETHEKAWADKWNDGRIDVEGDDELATTIHASLYYILMSLPSTQPELPLEQFYGLSPGSLARGANWTDYQGHVFWDMETWMYPPILALFPDLARDMLSYRIYGGEGARAKAREHGYEGWQFPWESAFTGHEMTPLICVPCREYEQHITGDVAFAARQFWAVTRDRHWLLQDGGLQLILNTAAFWADRAEYNEEEDRYDISGVMPPDERAEHVNNSIYTNYMAKVNIQLAHYISCLAPQRRNSSQWDHSLQVARKLYMVFNETGQFHPEYEGYDCIDTAWNHDQIVKQADTVMLGYPLGMEMDDRVRRNDLDLYSARGDPGGPAMTWSMFAINWLELGQLELAANNFNKSYTWYTRKPFHTWTETREGIGAANFITGMGGFLQAVIFGYGGYRIGLEHVTFSPRLPPNTHKLHIRGIKYLGSSLDLLVTEDHVLVVVREMSKQFPLQLRTTAAGTTWRLRAGLELTLKREPFEISTLVVTECPVPEGSSCPDVVTVDNSSGRQAVVPANVGTVHVSQTGGDRCGNFLDCSGAVQNHMMKDDTINFYIGDDNRVYQGASVTSTVGVLEVALLGDYTLSGMTREQEALLRRLIKCGMETEPPRVDLDYKLQFAAEVPEDCGSAPCAGNSLHCQLMGWLHWDSTQETHTAQPDCNSVEVTTHGTQHQRATPSITHTDRPRPTYTPLPTPQTSRTGCPPPQPAEITCNCRMDRAATGSSNSAARIVSPGYTLVLVFIMFCRSLTAK